MILGLKHQTARRFSPSINTQGVVSAGAFMEFDFKGAIQPLTAKEREALDAYGFATRAEYKLFTRAQLHTVDAEGGIIADQVKHRGRWLEVFGWEDWADAPFLAHHEYILLKPEAGT